MYRVLAILHLIGHSEKLKLIGSKCGMWDRRCEYLMQSNYYTITMKIDA